MTKLKLILQKTGLRQTALAKRLGVSRAAISVAAAKGIRNLSAAERYAEAIGCCSPLELMDVKITR